jgi:hypothetical protein
MDAHQMLVHLGDGAEAASGRRAFGAPIRRGNRIIKWIALGLPLPWPRGLRTGADPAARSLPADEFGADRDRAIGTLQALAAAADGTLAASHPIFGPMTTRDWHRWAYLHTDHHLRQFGL